MQLFIQSPSISGIGSKLRLTVVGLSQQQSPANDLLNLKFVH